MSHAGILQNLRRYGSAMSRHSYDPDFLIQAIGVNWEDPDLYCDETGDRIPSAYAEPEESAS